MQHFLETCHSNRSRSAVHLHQYHMERPPHQKKIEKKVGVAKSTFSPWKSHFFSGGKSLISLRAQRAFLENFGGLVVQRDAICRSVSKPQKNPRALCQCNVTILKRLRGGARHADDDKSPKSIISQSNLATARSGKSAPPPGRSVSPKNAFLLS